MTQFEEIDVSMYSLIRGGVVKQQNRNENVYVCMDDLRSTISEATGRESNIGICTCIHG